MSKEGNAKPLPAHDWYLPEWMEQYAKIQADLEQDLDWNKSKASLMMRRKQRYHRDDVNQVAAYLNLQPYELLMHPQDAMAIRQLRIDARRIAVDGPPFEVLANDQIEHPSLRVAEKSAAFHGKESAVPASAPNHGSRRRRGRA
jgi:hypothetical protein